MLDKEELSFEFKAKKAMWTNQSKTDRISRRYPSPSNLLGIIQSVFDHPKIYPVVTGIDILSVPKYDSYTINGRKHLNIREDDRTQLFIQPVCDVHYKVIFRWLHLEEPTGEILRKVQEQTWRNLKVLFDDLNLPEVERLGSYKAGGKFGSRVEIYSSCGAQPVDINEENITPFYRFQNGEFYFNVQQFNKGSWRIDPEILQDLVCRIEKDKIC